MFPNKSWFRVKKTKHHKIFKIPFTMLKMINFFETNFCFNNIEKIIAKER